MPAAAAQVQPAASATSAAHSAARGPSLWGGITTEPACPPAAGGAGHRHGAHVGFAAADQQQQVPALGHDFQPHRGAPAAHGDRLGQRVLARLSSCAVLCHATPGEWEASTLRTGTHPPRHEDAGGMPRTDIQGILFHESREHSRCGRCRPPIPRQHLTDAGGAGPDHGAPCRLERQNPTPVRESCGCSCPVAPTSCWASLTVCAVLFCGWDATRTRPSDGTVWLLGRPDLEVLDVLPASGPPHPAADAAT